MNQTAREIFMRMATQGPMGALIYVPSIPAIPPIDADSAGEAFGGHAEVPGHYRERTDDELDQLVAYAVRAAAAYDRESQRYAAAHPTPRPMPTSTPRTSEPGPRPKSAADIARAFLAAFRGAR